MIITLFFVIINIVVYLGLKMKITHAIFEEDEERELLCLEVLRSLCDRFEFELLAPKGHRIFGRIGTPRVKKTPIDIGMSTDKMLRNIVVLSRFFARSRPDAVHFHSGGALILSARLGGVKHILATPQSVSGRGFFETVGRFASLALSHSKGCSASLRKMGGVFLPVSIAGFSLSSFDDVVSVPDAPPAHEKLTGGERYIIFDVRREDDLRTAVLALSHVIRYFYVKGIFILREERFASVRRIASSLGILEYTACIPPSEAGNLSARDCLCLVCMTDGVLPPLSLLYFAARGVPPLVARRSVISDYVIDGESGLHFSLSDFSSLKDRLLSLCLDPVFRRRLSYGAYLQSKEKRAKDVSKEYTALYTSLMT